MIKGIGIGIIISTTIMLLLGFQKISDVEVEKRAYDLGMIYKDECKITIE